MQLAIPPIKRPSDEKPMPYLMKLSDGRSLFIEIPADMVRIDRDGSTGFTSAGIRFLDRIRALASQMGEKPTPGHIAALRQALDLTQRELGERIGVDKLTVSRWERGEIKPSGDSVARLQALRRKAVAKGVIVPKDRVRSASRFRAP